jgi:hypothetical protein
MRRLSGAKLPSESQDAARRLRNPRVTTQNGRTRNPQQQEKPEPIQQNEDQELDVVEEALLESFPASDPPGWIGGETKKKAAVKKAR